MCNAVKHLFLAMALSFGFMACSDNSQEEEAKALVGEIEALLQNGDANGALSLMDSLNLKYPDQVEARRNALALRPKVIEYLTLRRIESADSLIAVTKAAVEALEPELRHVTNDRGLDGYYVYKAAYDPNFINKQGLEARINDADNTFYIVAQTPDPKFQLSQVVLVGANDEAASQPLPAATARRLAVEGWEIATFLPEEVDALGSWANENSRNIKSAVLKGQKGDKKIVLTPSQAQSFGMTWRIANLQQQLRSVLIMREKLERQLQVARDQAANQTPEIN